MGIEISEWPAGAVDRAVELARGIPEAQTIDVVTAKRHLIRLIADTILTGCPAHNAAALADQVLARPDLVSLADGTSTHEDTPGEHERPTHRGDPVSRPPDEGPPTRGRKGSPRGRLNSVRRHPGCMGSAHR
jgi:hypothetical protein